MRGSPKLTDAVLGTTLKNGRLLSGEERHARLPGSRLPPVPQHVDGGHQPGRRLGKDHAINCGVCGRRVIAAGLTGRGLQWHGSIDPEVWANKLWDFASEGVDPVTVAEGDRGREQSRVVAAAAVVHYVPGDSPLCGLEKSPEPMTPDPELVRVSRAFTKRTSGAEESCTTGAMTEGRMAGGVGAVWERDRTV